MSDFIACKTSLIFFILLIATAGVNKLAYAESQTLRSLTSINSTQQFVNTLNNGVSQNTRGEAVQTVVNTAIEYQRINPTQFWTSFVSELRNVASNSFESCLFINKSSITAANINNYIYLCTAMAANLDE